MSPHDMNNRTPRKPYRQLGVTLVELMVALTIGLIILAALGQLFVTSRATYSTEEGLARTQEAGRFAMEFLTQDIRMAGFAGCNNPSQAGVVTGAPGAGTACSTSFCDMVSPSTDATRFAAEGIRGYVYTGAGGTNRTDWTPALPGTPPTSFFNDGEVKAGTDVIVIQYALSTNTYVTAVNPGADMKITNTTALKDTVTQNDILVVSDCKQTDVFRITNTPNWSSDPVTLAHAVNGNLSPFLSHTYAPNTAEILKLTSRAYYIGTGTGGEPALMRKDLAIGGVVSAAQELVQGIEDMRAMYGVDTDPPSPPAAVAPDRIANRYVLASNVVDLVGLGTTNWDDVVSLRIGLLIRTPANADQVLDTRVYELVDGVSVNPPDDNRRRQVYRTTIELRNN